MIAYGLKSHLYAHTDQDVVLLMEGQMELSMLRGELVT